MDQTAADHPEEVRTERKAMASMLEDSGSIGSVQTTSKHMVDGCSRKRVDSILQDYDKQKAFIYRLPLDQTFTSSVFTCRMYLHLISYGATNRNFHRLKAWGQPPNGYGLAPLFL